MVSYWMRGIADHFSSVVLILVVVDDGLVLTTRQMSRELTPVLILVVVDDGLVPVFGWLQVGRHIVLILVVVDDGLVLDLIRLF